MNSEHYGLYVHIPFCARKCQYCDFVSYTGVSQYEVAYVAALKEEIKKYSPRHVDTIYFGGGTPSLLSEQSMAEMITAIFAHFCVEENAEITIEVNPASASKEKLAFYRKLGINRVSIGVQSTQQNELAYLGRLHSAMDAQNTVMDAKNVGFSNISMDLMYGFYGQTMESLQKTLDTMTSWPISHISCYGLRVEPKTPFGKRETSGEAIVQTDDSYADMYAFIVEKLSKKGFARYEISNFAKENRYSRHNMKYWHHVPYIGLGVAAHSYFEHTRYQNTNDIETYLNNPQTSYEKLSLSKSDEKSEYIITALRTTKGFLLSDYQKLFESDFLKDYVAPINQYQKLGLLVIEDGRCHLSESAFYVSNAILCDFV